MTKLHLKTSKNRQVLDITDQIQSMITEEDFDSGVLNLFVMHTTAALTTADLDPGTDEDYLKALDQLTPKLDYKHPHNPTHFPDHFLSTSIGTSLSVPVEDGKLILGTWQKIVLFEFNGPREREIVLTFLPGSA